MDPEQITDTTAAEAAATTTTEPESPAPSIEESALAALDEGLSGEPAASAPTAAPAAAPASADPAKGGAQPAPIPGTNEAAAADAAKAAADAAAAAPARDEATETEITALGLKEKAAERFRTMAGEIKELAPLREALEKAGIKEIDQLPQLVQHATDYRDLIGMVQETGATPEQYGMSLDYLKLVNAANNGDLRAAEQAFNLIQGEVAELARMLGKEVPGVHDPLTAYPDLQRDLDAGTLSRERALEMAQQRNALAMSGSQRQAAEQRNAAEIERNNAVSALDALGIELSKADPDFAAKQPYLIAALGPITENVPPSKWEAAARAAYARIPKPLAAAPVPAVAPAPARPVPGPVRGVSVRQPVTAVTDDPMAALEMGIADASG